MKYDGYRCLAAIDGPNVKFYTRNGLDWTDRFAKLVKPVQELGVKNALIDGEVVALDAKGKSDFATLQKALSTGHDLVYFVFDLLSENGKDLTKLPLVERKERLKALLGKTNGSSLVLYSDHVRGSGEELFKEICKKGFEGIVSKRADSRYRPGRSRDWLKVKCSLRQEFVIGGWQESERRHGFRSLLLGYYDGDDFVYAGKVGTGFDDALLESLGAKLAKREIAKSPFTARLEAGKQDVALGRAGTRRRDRLYRIHRRRASAPPLLHRAARGQAGARGEARDGRRRRPMSADREQRRDEITRGHLASAACASPIPTRSCSPRWA